VLIHHTCLKTSAIMSMESIKMVLKAFPAGAWTTDRTGATCPALPCPALPSPALTDRPLPQLPVSLSLSGALPLHWITHNAHCSQEMVQYLINANPKGPWVADVDG
jgi:hypothetical protein